jgi:hypothetical protein
MILLNDVGENNEALYCLTDNSRRYTGRIFGEWITPDGTDVSGSTANSFYRIRGYGAILMNKRSGAVGQTGIYTCLIPDRFRINRTLYIGIYNDGNED